MMLVLAITLMAIGSFGVGAAVFMEVKTHEPKYKVIMKICPWLIGVGGILTGIVIAGG